MSGEKTGGSGQIALSQARGTWVVRAGDAIIAETAQAVELREAGHDRVIYFPRGDVAMAFLERADKQTHCPHKGDASYYSIAAASVRVHDAAWSYETPLDGMGDIAGHLAFDGEKVTIEQL